jgi:hypothetical protein
VTRRPATREEWIVAAAWAAGSSVVWAGRAWLPALAALGPACPFHTLTGFPCLACGTTRAVLLLAAGDPLGAFLMNPLAATAIAAAWLGGFTAPIWLGLGLPLPGVPRSLPASLRLSVTGLLLANWCFLVVRGV